MTFTTVVLNPPLAPLEVAVLDADRLRRAFRRIAGAALGKRLRELDRKDAKGHKGVPRAPKTPSPTANRRISDGPARRLTRCCRQS